MHYVLVVSYIIRPTLSVIAWLCTRTVLCFILLRWDLLLNQSS